MNDSISTLNPFYAARLSTRSCVASRHIVPPRRYEPDEAVYAKLPRVPAQRQPGAASHEPLPQLRSRPIRQPELPRQLWRQPHQGPAAILQYTHVF